MFAAKVLLFCCAYIVFIFIIAEVEIYLLERGKNE
tara:strand:+ start:1864 stop:1968 length:105 start_codon:yes stop_codon:yes gene_type:complete